MGDAPFKRASLERIDNDGDYEPGNVRWASQTEQMRNTRGNRVIEFNGKAMCVSDWETALGMPQGVLRQRLHCGWGEERAITQPVRKAPSRKPQQQELQEQR